MVQRYENMTKNGVQGGSTSGGSRVATLTRSEFSGFSTNPAQSLQNRQLSTAMSMQSQQSVTAQSTML